MRRLWSGRLRLLTFAGGTLHGKLDPPPSSSRQAEAQGAHIMETDKAMRKAHRQSHTQSQAFSSFSLPPSSVVMTSLPRRVLLVFFASGKRELKVVHTLGTRKRGSKRREIGLGTCGDDQLE
eukprot:GHVT01022615.1.p1 GENE.GHVT01022615.1~~GHVT01022615.1.p1  ORF type:complete len:138 (-),score=29.88 GHVT01022615.1:2903-3268(-)